MIFLTLPTGLMFVTLHPFPPWAQTVLVKVCDDLQSNLIQILTLSAAAIVGIVLLSIVGVLIVYGIQV